MKTSLILCLGVALFLVSCQPATPSPEPSPDGRMETQIASTIFANQTSTAAADNANQTATMAAAAAKLSPFQVALTSDALTAAVRTPIPTPSRYEFTVPASACWIKSDVSVDTGQKVKISASGTANTNGGAEGSNSEPDGQIFICGDIECPVRGVGYGALVGRLEDNKAFFVGNNFEFVATRDGYLYFSINDWKCDDNFGAFSLIITVE